MVSVTPDRRRAKLRAYRSISTASLVYPCRGSVRAVISSVKNAGSLGSAPYTAVVDFMTTFRTRSARWQAPRSCIVPMTLISFICSRPPTPAGVARMWRWTTVSTSVVWSTFTVNGFRMSARTYSVRSRSAVGSSNPTPTT
jgi:hypothetical protein